ncbi:SRPBCC domain-containing protein, partial [Streptomyces sp. NPDC057654]
YLHTLRQYLTHFPGRRAVYTAADGPAASSAPGSFEAVRRGLGLAAGTAAGARVRAEPAGIGPLDAVLDYSNAHFVGLRTDDALYRFFGRDAFGAPVGLAVHQFAADADQKETGRAWQEWLTGLFA